MAKDYLVIGWEKFKILENAVLVTENSTIRICLYNPFYGNKTSRSPKFYCQFIEYNNIWVVLRNVKEFVRERTQNLHEYPIKVNIFNFPMLSQAVYDASGNITHFSGINGNTVSVISEIMNFTPIYVASEDGSLYGSQVNGEHFTGFII